LPRPGTGALRQAFRRSAAIGNFEVRVKPAARVAAGSSFQDLRSVAAYFDFSCDCGGRGAKTLNESPSAVVLPEYTEK